MKAFTHFAESDRRSIERGLNARKTFKQLAQELKKHPSSIAREVKKNRELRESGGSGQCFNECLHKAGCKRRGLSGHNTPCFKKYCHTCLKCPSVCSEFERYECPRLEKAPNVCNGCRSLSFCTLKKAFYYAVAAEEKSGMLLSESRSGITADEAELARMDAIFTPRIQKGQSIYHICESEKGNLSCSPRTIYNYIDRGCLTARNIDLVKKVGYRQRRKKNYCRGYKVDKKCRIGRGYEEFKKYMAEHPDTPLVEMDTVEGSKSKVLLTIHFVEMSLMCAFLRDANTAASVTEAFTTLHKRLGQELFAKLFPVILTDNGTEFSDPAAIEELSGGHTRIFYCLPNASWQKGAIENNHIHLRRVLPKGTDFDWLTQREVELMTDHVNSYRREKLNGHTPYESFSFHYGERVLSALGVRSVPPEDIILHPDLLGHR